MKITESTVILGQNTIQHATRQNQWLFAGYMLVLVLSALFTYLLWKSGNDVQDAVTAVARADTAKAQSEAAQANERSKELEQSNLVLRGQLAALEQTTAQLKKAASDSEAAQQKVALELEKQKERTANAEQSLAKLRQSVQDRSITPEQAAKFRELTRTAPTGVIELVVVISNPETAKYGEQIRQLLQSAGWHVRISSTLMTDTLGISARFRTELVPQTLPDGRIVFPSNALISHGVALVQALRAIGLKVNGPIILPRQNYPEGFVELVVGNRDTTIP